MKRSKRYQEAANQVDKQKTYSMTEAFDLIKKTSTTKFDSSVEVHIHLGIDLKKPDQQVRATAQLPHSTGRKRKILVLANDADQKKALEAGASQAGGEDLIKEIKKTQKVNADIVLATPEMMKKIGQVAKILGTKGLMPNPKNETITADVAKTIKDLASGKIAFRSDESGNVHQIIGKVSFDQKILEDNFRTFVEAVRKAKPAEAKGIYIQGITLTTTMGPGIRVAS